MNCLVCWLALSKMSCTVKSLPIFFTYVTNLDKLYLLVNTYYTNKYLHIDTYSLYLNKLYIMTNIFIYSFIVYGVCNILIWGSNFKWWRSLLSYFGEGGYSLHKLFTCFMCLPTWIGAGLSALSIYLGDGSLAITNHLGFDNIAIILLLDGVFASGIVWCINTVQEYFENKTSD